MSATSLTIEENGEVTIVSFRDNSILDVMTIQRIGKELYDLVEADERKKILLNFQMVRFLSSQALGVLLTLRRKAEKAGAEVVLAELRPELARVFKITNLDEMFKLFEGREDALAHFGVEPPSQS